MLDGPGFFWLILVLDLVLGVAGNAQGDALIELKNSLADPNKVLQSWDASLSTPCTCDLGNANLSGQLVMQLDQLPDLQYLELYSNNITGGIPEQLGNLTELVSLDLYLNNLSGPIPATLGRLKKLRFLELFSNNITGGIPEQLGNLTELVSLNLYMNNLSGPIPSTLGRLKKLRFLLLNNNNLSGEIPRSWTAPSTLQVLRLNNNSLSGGIPRSLTVISTLQVLFANTKLRYRPASLTPPLPSSTPTSSGGRITGAIAGGVAASAALFFAFVAVSIALARRRRRTFLAENVHSGPSKRFSLRELQVAAHNFRDDLLVGEGGFGKVYRGRLTDGSLVAIKRLNEKRIQAGELQFQTEVELISMAVHRNVLWLRGFCMTPTERLLVYDYMVNGSVASCLRERPESQPPLDWPKRQRIALGSARGLAYLHDYCDPKIIHRDVKASNILLDAEFEAVIGDFGLAKLMEHKDTHVTTVVRGTIGHIAPEYLASGKSSEKTDVFGYGVMLLELITGQKAFDLSRIAREDGYMLLEWVKGLLKDKMLEALVDVDVEGNYKYEEVEQLIQVSLLCTQISPKERPKMSEVVKMLEGDGFAERWEEWQKEETSRQIFNYETLDQLNIVSAATSHVGSKYPLGPR